MEIETKKVDDAKSIFTLSCAACYCLALTIATGYYYFNQNEFTGGINSDCYASETSVDPVSSRTNDAVNVNGRFESLLLMGFIVHFVGIFSDGSMALRVKV